MEPYKIVEMLQRADVDPDVHSIIAIDYLTGIAALDAGKQPDEFEWYAMGLVEGLIEGGYGE